MSQARMARTGRAGNGFRRSLHGEPVRLADHEDVRQDEG
jgi:hypothetical protein